MAAARRRRLCRDLCLTFGSGATTAAVSRRMRVCAVEATRAANVVTVICGSGTPQAARWAPPPRARCCTVGMSRMVVVVVRDEHRVDRRQLGQRDRWRMKALRADGERRGVVREDRVDQQAHAIEFDPHAAMTDPERAQPRAGGAFSACGSTRTTGIGVGGARTSLPLNWPANSARTARERRRRINPRAVRR